MSLDVEGTGQHSVQLQGEGQNNVLLEHQSMVGHRKYPLFTFDHYLGVKVTQNVAQYPLHHVTYAPAKFEVAMSNG